jgi:lysozyme family protein
VEVDLLVFEAGSQQLNKDIVQAGTLSPKGAAVTAIFISHRSSDAAEASFLKCWLHEQGHQQLFLDFDPVDGIPTGVDWEQRLYRELRRCQAVLIALTPAWLESMWCRNELAIAREKGKAIFVARMKPVTGGPLIAGLQEIDLTQGRETELIRLARGLKEHGLDPSSAFDWQPDRPIYPGLAAFDVEDAAIFFGRSEESCQVVEALRRMRLQAAGTPKMLLITGASGSGKSSLMRAGVLARLRKESRTSIVLRPIRRGNDAMAALADALADAFPPDARSTGRVVLDRTASADGHQKLLAIARELRTALSSLDASLVVSIDQAEELLEPDQDGDRERLLELLRETLSSVGNEIVVLATIRSDRLGDWQQHKSIKAVTQVEETATTKAIRAHDEFSFAIMPLGPMPMDRIGEIVRKPADYEGLTVEDRLVDTIGAQTDTPDALPLLAYALRYMHDRFATGGRLTLADYASFGGLEGAIRNQADAAIPVEQLGKDDLQALRDAFVPGLVRASEDGKFSRNTALLQNLPARAEPYLRRLVDEARLLRTDSDAKGNTTIEVAHEALLRVWPTLARWIAEDAANLRRLEALQRAAADWAQNDDGADFLIHRDHRLADAGALAAVPRFNAQLEDKDRRYLSACRARQTQREQEERAIQERELRAAQELARRRRQQTVYAVIAAIIILALGVFAAWIFRENARTQELLASTRQTQITQLQNENTVLSKLLRQEYQQRFNNAKIRDEAEPPVAEQVRKILANKDRYETVVKGTSMPWYFLAIIHGLEASFDFNTHMYNGDPLTERTVHAPVGRPKEGNPPFTWEQSAADEIRERKYDQWNDWSTAGMLVLWEQFNGMGLSDQPRHQFTLCLGMHRPLREGQVCGRRTLRPGCGSYLVRRRRHA